MFRFHLGIIIFKVNSSLEMWSVNSMIKYFRKYIFTKWLMSKCQEIKMSPIVRNLYMTLSQWSNVQSLPICPPLPFAHPLSPLQPYLSIYPYLCLTYHCNMSIILFLNLPFNPSVLSLSPIISPSISHHMVSPNFSLFLLNILTSLPPSFSLSLFCPYPYILYLHLPR